MANLARELAGRGVQVILLLNTPEDIRDAHYLETLRGAGVELLSAFSPANLQQGIKLSRLHEDFFKNIPAPRPVRLRILSLAGALGRLNPDVVHSYLDNPNCIAGCAAVLAGVHAHLASFRNVDPQTAGFTAADVTLPIYRYLLANTSSRFEANSKAGQWHYARWLGITPERIAYTPNGIDASAFTSPSEEARQEVRRTLELPEAAPTILTLARFAQEKSPQSMLDIFARVHARQPEAHYVIAGTGMTEVGEMAAMVQARGLDKAVHLAGVRSDVAALLACADVFLLPSKVEGFPNAVMEAMAAAVPVVASGVGGIPDLVRHGQNGFLHAADDVDAMARSVLTLIADAEMRARFGDAGHKRIVGEFSLQKLGDRTLQKYQELLGKTGSTTGRSAP